ncbi:hypothetical protein [Methylotuvimicrobium sp.]|uniref:hypothetical protein n=1 Tax=Methylotuvimicrobium sp. TaxID=2822413 RepID=UPI003D661BE9
MTLLRDRRITAADGKAAVNENIQCNMYSDLIDINAVLIKDTENNTYQADSN